MATVASWTKRKKSCSTMAVLGFRLFDPNTTSHVMLMKIRHRFRNIILKLLHLSSVFIQGNDIYAENVEIYMRPVALGCLMPHNRSRHWGAPPQARPHPPPCLAPTLCQEFSERINLCMKSKLSLVKDRDFNTSRSQNKKRKSKV